ncbi:ArfGap-domain-containing protein [Thelephora ganbajun]|uniref:ArfGap-domain-containing protein n=1 Tax=Thelephora ganbajun TaxID=370292 RepID=A0ACB6ZCQ9_THEGA|nr:ArfGap-domain-containing protein [Thelephora ganbajun]
MSSHAVSKIQAERNQKQLLELVAQPGNDVCADCKTKHPRWASHNLGIFVCVKCASIHRKIGTHITKVKSITLDTWSKDQVDTMKEMGNVKSNAIYNPDEIRNPPPTNMIEQERDSDLEKYIRAKYEFKKFFDKRGVVAAKLGPSRSKDSFMRESSPQPPTRSSTMPSSTSPAPKPTIQSSLSQPTVNLPPRSASTVVQPTQDPVQPAAPRPASAWNDLAFLSTSSSNASLPLQYAANPTPAQSMIQQSTSFNSTNPYANLAVTPGLQPLPSPLSQPLSLPLQQTPAMGIQTPGFNGSLQPPFGGTSGLLSMPQPQPTNPFTPQTQQFNTGITLGTGLNSMTSLQQPFSAAAFPNQTFLPQQTQSFPTQQLQQPGVDMLSATFPGQMQGFQQLTPNAAGNPFYAMQQQQLQQVQPTGYIPQHQQTFGVSPTNPFGRMMQPGTSFATAQSPGWQNAGFPVQQQPWG